MRYLRISCLSFLLFILTYVSFKHDVPADVVESVTDSTNHVKESTIVGNTLNVGEELMRTIASYAENVALSEGYTKYFLTEGYNNADEDYIVVNIVFEDVRYYNIMVDRNTLNITKICSCDITDRLLESWEYNKEISNE